MTLLYLDTQSDYARSGDELADIYKELGDLFGTSIINQKKAIACYLTAIKYYKTLGETGLENLINTRITLATIAPKHYFDTTLAIEAISIYDQIYDSTNIKFGTLYFTLGILYHNMAMISSKTTDQIAFRHIALKYKEKAIQIFKRHYDKYNVEMAKNYHNIAVEYAEIGTCEENVNFAAKAIQYEKLALNIYENELGEYNVETLFSRYHLAYFYGEVGNRELTLRIYKEVIPLLTKALGKDNFRLTIPYENMAYELKNVGDYKNAYEYYQFALQIYQNNPQLYRNDIMYVIMRMNNLMFEYEQQL